MMVKFEEFAKGVGYDEKLRLARAYFPKEFKTKEGYKLTPAALSKLTQKQKRKITKRYNQIRPFIGATSRKVYTRNFERASAAWRSLYGIEPPGDTLYVPVVGNAPKLEYYEAAEDDLRARVRDENVLVNKYFFADYGITPKMLMANPEKVLRDLHETIGGSRYSIITGDHVMTQGGAVFVGTIDDIIRQYNRMQNRYGAEKKKNMFNDVLIGLQAYSFDQIEDFTEYRDEQYEKRKARQKLKDELSKINKNLKSASERLAHFFEIRKDNGYELRFLLSGVRGRERVAFTKQSTSIKNLTKKLNKLDAAIRESKKTIDKLLKQQKVITKELMK